MPSKEQGYIVDGFVFSSESEAEKAKKEQEKIKYIKEKINMNNPEMVLQIYNKVVREKMFVTVLGYAYLYDLQEYLRSIPFIKKADIVPIGVVHPSVQESLREEKRKYQEKLTEAKKKAAKEPEKDSETKKKYKISLVLNIILALSVVCMFVISATSGHPTILNYEEELINRYSAWEQELTEREAALREAERVIWKK